MSQQKQHNDSNLKLPETLSSCTQSHQLSPPPLSSPAPSPSTINSDDSIQSTVSSDMVLSLEKRLKRRREEEVSRCSCNGCKKKLGLMGFRCRCGDMFCSEHRYSDRHACSFDYKAAGKEIIAKENPVVRAPKLVKV